jgi:septum formation inhibitor MinC
MLPLYQVLIVVVLGITGAVLYLYKPDDPTDTEQQRSHCRNCRRIGLFMVIAAAIAALYILFFSKLSFRASQPSGNQEQPPPPPPQPSRASQIIPQVIQTGSQVMEKHHGFLGKVKKGGKVVEEGGEFVGKEIEHNPEILGVVAMAALA